MLSGEYLYSILRGIVLRRCRSPICWDDINEHRINRPDLVENVKAKVQVARLRLSIAQGRQKSYVDLRCHDLEFRVGDPVLLKVSQARGIKHFGNWNKLSPRLVGPFEVLERLGPVAYRLTFFSPNLTRVHDVFHVSMFRKYIGDSSPVISPVFV